MSRTSEKSLQQKRRRVTVSIVDSIESVDVAAWLERYANAIVEARAQRLEPVEFNKSSSGAA
jgi:hypothetical protein